MGARGIILGIGAATLLSACAPLPVSRAETFCAERFRTPPPISGQVKAGVSDGDLSQGYELNLQPGVYIGDPNSAYNACVQRKSGQFPTRSLTQVGG